MKKHILGFLAPLLVVVGVGASLGGITVATEGCTKPQAQTALDAVRVTVDQAACIAAEYELSHTDPNVVKLACSSLVDTDLSVIEKLLLAQQKGTAMAAAKRAAAAAGQADAGAKP